MVILTELTVLSLHIMVTNGWWLRKKIMING